MNIQAKFFPMIDFEKYAKNSVVVETASTLIRAYYFFILFFAVGGIGRAEAPVSAQIEFLPFWPNYWMKLLAFETAFDLVKIVFLVGSFLAAIFPFNRLARILVFIGLFQYVSLYISVVKIDVDWLGWVLTSFLLIFLPGIEGRAAGTTIELRKKFLLVFWGCQAIILLTYSMAGTGKLYGIFTQLVSGEVNLLSVQSPALHIADRIIKSGSKGFLAQWIINYSLLAWPFFIGAIYLLLFSFYAAFRPSLHRIWAIGLLLFHLSSLLTMNIAFSAYVLLVCIFLLNSPFDEYKGFKRVLADLPLIGFIGRRFRYHENKK